jgi:hypothetical protein
MLNLIERWYDPEEGYVMKWYPGLTVAVALLLLALAYYMQVHG